jgi:hypothetical protein
MLTLETPEKYRLGIHPSRPANWSMPRTSVQVLRLKTLRQSPIADPRRQALADRKASLMSLLDETRPQPAMSPSAPSPRVAAVRTAARKIFQTQAQTFVSSVMSRLPAHNRAQAFRRAIESIFEIQSGVQAHSQMTEPTTARRRSMLDRVRQATFQTQGYSFPRSFMSRPENA